MRPSSSAAGVQPQALRETHRWQLVRRWDGLDDAAKIAWDVLAQVARNRVNVIIDVHVAAVGAECGAADGSRSGKRRLEALRNQGLLLIRDKGLGGVWTLELLDPIQVYAARLMPDDPQKGFWDDLLDDDSPDVLSIEPAHSTPAAAPTGPAITGSTFGGTAAGPPNTCKRETSTSHISINAPARHQKKHVAGGPAAVPPERNEDAPSFEAAPALDTAQLHIANRIAASMGQQPALVEELMRYIRDQVADPELHEGILLRIAWDIVEGRYPRRKLEGVLRNVRTKTGPTPKDRGSYFMGGMTRSYVDVGLKLTVLRRTDANAGRR